MNLVSSDLGSIRKELEPEFSYVILERQGSPETEDDLSDLLQHLGLSILETRIHENTTSGRIFFVAKLDPEKANEISREYVSVSLPENVTCLFYGSLVQARGRSKKTFYKGSEERNQHKAKKGEKA